MILDLLFTYGPIILAFLGESVLVKVAISILKNINNTEEYKAAMEQNKILVQELRESKKLNKELLSKIDKIRRNEE